MCFMEILSIVLSSVSVIAVFYFGFTTRKMEKATAEYHAFCMLHNEDKEIANLFVTAKTQKIDPSALAEIILARRQIFLDSVAYVCGLYLDKKVEKKRFEKEYAAYIMKKIDEPENARLLQADDMAYKNILEVATIWSKKPPRSLKPYLMQREHRNKEQN